MTCQKSHEECTYPFCGLENVQRLVDKFRKKENKWFQNTLVCMETACCVHLVELHCSCALDLGSRANIRTRVLADSAWSLSETRERKLTIFD